MSAKNKDDKNRWRNKNVGFRCSPEEGIEIDKRWKMCGFCTKQDYILECLLHPYLIARGNPMMLISIRKELKEISVELSRIDDASEIDEVTIYTYSDDARDTGIFQKMMKAITGRISK